MGLFKYYVYSQHSPELLLKDVDDPHLDEKELRDATEFLSFLNCPEAAIKIRKLLDHSSSEIRKSACIAAYKHITFDIFKKIKHMSRNDSYEVCIAAKNTLSVWKEQFTEEFFKMENIHESLLDDHSNKVELVQFMGSDLDHALSAWTSTSRNINEEKKSRVPALLKMLAENGHHTPFEKSYIRFLVTSDIASHIHILKHRIGVSVNAESARYKELKDDKYYVPSDWDESERLLYIEHMEDCLKKYHDTLERLVKSGMSRKRAKESARFYLPYGNQIVSDVSFNFRSFMHFQGLRNKKDAQFEIADIAKKMLTIVWETGQLNKSCEAFGWDQGKVYGI